MSHNTWTAATEVGVLHRTVSRIAARGAAMERVLSDNGSDYHTLAWQVACA